VRVKRYITGQASVNLVRKGMAVSRVRTPKVRSLGVTLKGPLCGTVFISHGLPPRERPDACFHEVVQIGDPFL